MVGHPGGGRDLLAEDIDAIAPAARRATSEVSAGGGGRVDDGAASILLDPAGWPAVDDGQSNAVLVTAALKLSIAAEAHGRGGVPALAVTAAGTASSLRVAEAGQVVLAVRGNDSAAAGLAAAVEVSLVAGEGTSSKNKHNKSKCTHC